MTRETTPEQQSRDLLEQMGMLLDCGDGKTRDPQSMSSGELVFLANLIADKRRAEAERDALRALLREARDDWIKVGYGASHEDVAACRDFCDRIDAALGERDE